MKKFNKIEDLFNFLRSLNTVEQIEAEKIAKDLQLSESNSYDTIASIRAKGSLNATLPDFSTIPPSTVLTEAGVGVVEGFGRVKISFNRKFNDTPSVLLVPFGFFELKVPWVTVEWRSFTIGWWSVRLPVPAVNTMTIRIPSMCFMMDVDKDGFEVFNVFGRTTVSYIAFGR